MVFRDLLRFALGLALLFAFDAVGGLVVGALGLPLPGSVAGMLLLVGALATGVVRAEWVRPATRVLLPHLGLFFLPLAVGAALALDFASARVGLAALVTVVSTLAVLGTVGVVHQRLRS